MSKETNKQPRTGMQRKQLFRGEKERKRENELVAVLGGVFFLFVFISLSLPPIVGANLNIDIRKSCKRELEEEHVRFIWHWFRQQAIDLTYLDFSSFDYSTMEFFSSSIRCITRGESDETKALEIHEKNLELSVQEIVHALWILVRWRWFLYRLFHQIAARMERMFDGESLDHTSNMALRSSSRNRNGIFDTCKRFWIVPDVVLPCVEDVPLVLVDWGECEQEEFDWAYDGNNHRNDDERFFQFTVSILINSFADIPGMFPLVMVVPSRIVGDVDTLIISGKCEVESTTRLFVGLESFAAAVAIVA